VKRHWSGSGKVQTLLANQGSKGKKITNSRSKARRTYWGGDGWGRGDQKLFVIQGATIGRDQKRGLRKYKLDERPDRGNTSLQNRWTYRGDHCEHKTTGKGRNSRRALSVKLTSGARNTHGGGGQAREGVSALLHDC